MNISAFDHPPPKTWEEFEELCADTFQALFNDPTLVRYGRTGQKQNGVDILCSHGSAWPIGLQCKQKGAWPPKKLTKGQIKAEIDEAAKFHQKLKQFWILTTAPQDTALQDYVDKMNAQPERADSFKVYYLGWGEIVRRATQAAWVAEKHFGPYRAGRSPLLATLVAKGGELQENDEALQLTIEELRLELADQPEGHFVVRSVASEGLREQIKALTARPRTLEVRKARLELVKKRQAAERRERRAADGIRIMLEDPDLSRTLFVGFERDLDIPRLVRTFVRQELARTGGSGKSMPLYAWSSLPR